MGLKLDMIFDSMAFAGGITMDRREKLTRPARRATATATPTARSPAQSSATPARVWELPCSTPPRATRLTSRSGKPALELR